MLELPIPRFDPTLALHMSLASASMQAEALVAGLPIPPNFIRARTAVRIRLVETGLAGTIDDLTAQLLRPATVAERLRPVF
jgi:hypothetical protein